MVMISRLDIYYISYRLIQAFEQSPPLHMIHGTCSDDYNGDPDECDLTFEDEISPICNHPSATPTEQPTFRPTSANIPDTLSPGSVVIKGYDQSGNSFEVVSLVDIPVDTTLRFTGVGMASLFPCCMNECD